MSFLTWHLSTQVQHCPRNNLSQADRQLQRHRKCSRLFVLQFALSEMPGVKNAKGTQGAACTSGCQWCTCRRLSKVHSTHAMKRHRGCLRLEYSSEASKGAILHFMIAIHDRPKLLPTGIGTRPLTHSSQQVQHVCLSAESHTQGWTNA
jgi:hypothetical protein